MTEDNEDKILMQLFEAVAIRDGLRLLINQLQTSNYVHDESYRSLISFCSDLHWRYHKITQSHKVEYDIFGKLRLKHEDRQSSNLN